MRRWLSLLLLASSCAAAAAMLTPEQHKQNDESFEYVWTTIHDKYWDPAMGGLDWKAVRNELKPAMDKAQTIEQARAVLKEMLDRLHLTHFAIIPEAGSDDTDPGTPAPSGGGVTGIDLRVLDYRAIVTSVDAGSPAAAAGVHPGWEIVRAAKTPFAPVIAKLEKVYEHSSLRDLILRETLLSRLQGSAGGQIEVAFRDGAGNLLAKKLGLIQSEGTLSTFGYLPPAYVWIESKKLPEDIEYIRFNMFLDPVHVMSKFAGAVASCINCRGFIIDVRGNPGGIGVMAMGMAGWFVDEPGLRLGTLYLRSGKMNFVINPRAHVFSGPLAILVDDTSASTSEIFAGGLKDLKRARIFGTRTAAAALPSAIEMLPNGDGFQYAMANYVSEGGKPLEGLGVAPDVVAPLTREALLAGKDPALDAAVDWIQSTTKGTR